MVRYSLFNSFVWLGCVISFSLNAHISERQLPKKASPPQKAHRICLQESEYPSFLKKISKSNSSSFFGPFASFTKAGVNTLTLTGNSGTSMSGVPTTISAGTLALSSAGAISSTDALTIGASGTFDISAASGAITVGSIAGAGAINLGTNGIVSGSAGSTVFSGATASTAGTFTKTGAGTTLTLSGVNLHSGTTTISGGTLALSGSGSIANSSVLIASSSTFDISAVTTSATVGNLSTGPGAGTVNLGAKTLIMGNSSSTSFAGSIIGSGGSLTKQGSGIFTLTAATNTYSGTTTINAGTVQAGVAGAFSSSSAVVFANVSGATLDLNNLSNTITALSGGGSSGGVVSLGSGTLTFGDSSSTTFAGSITGSGGIIKQGSGTTTFSGSGLNTYSGTTAINVGILRAGALNAFSSSSAVTLADVAGVALSLNGFNNTIGDLSGGGTTGGNVTLGAGALTFGTSNSTTFDGTVSGTGQLTKQGSGQTTFSNTVTATGGITISQGTVSLNAATSSGLNTLLVQSGATLKGNTTITTSTLLNQGDVTPGNSIGTIFIVGNYNQTGNLNIEFNDTSSDLLSVSGTATLGGTLTVYPTFGNYGTNTTYTILSAQSVSGTFSSIINNLPALGFDVVYGSTTVKLLINKKALFDVTGLTGNAAIIAQCLVPPAVSEAIDNYLTFMTLPELQATVSQMGSSMFNGMNLAQESAMIRVRKAVSREMSECCVPVCYKQVGPHLWADAFYTHTAQQTQGEGIGYNSKPRGGLVGLDYVWEPPIYTGFAYGYTRDDVTWQQGWGLARIDSYYGSLYAGGVHRHYYAQAALLGALSGFQAQRNIYFGATAFPSFTRSAFHDKGGWEALANMEMGLFFGDPIEMRLYATGDYMYSHRYAFQEKGAASINLAVQDYNTDLLRIEAGAELLKCFQMRKTQWTPYLTLGGAWEQRFIGRFSTSSFEASSCKMEVSGLLPNRSLFLLDAGLKGHITKELYFTVDYEGEWSSDYYDSTVSLEIKLGF